MKWIKRTICKRWRLFVTVAFLCCALLLWARWRPAQRFEFAPNDANELRLVTWNVGYFAVSSDKNVRTRDLDPIARKITAIDADVVCLQELGSLDHAQKIAAFLGPPWHAHSVATSHGNQVLSTLSRLPCLAQEDASCGGRMVKAVTLRAPNGQDMTVINFHAPHPVRGLRDTQENIKGALNLGKKHRAQRPEGLCFVLGDSNYDFDLEGDFYREICTYYGDGTRHLGNTYYAQTRLDHFFHYPKTLPVLTEESGLVDLHFRLARVPGHRDHRPIVVTYQLPDFSEHE